MAGIQVDPQYALDIFVKTVTTEYWKPDGRVHRKAFWHYFLVWFGITLACMIFNAILPFLSILTVFVQLGLLAPGIGIAIRRVHDIGQPWFMALIPFYNLYLFSIPGDRGDNEYGPDPLGGLARLA